MKFAAVAISAAFVSALVVVPFLAIASVPHDFDAVVSAVEHRYSAHAERVPMMGFVSFCAWATTRGGVKGMKIAEFDHLPATPDSAEMEKLVREALGPQWEPFVTDRERDGDLSVIYVQPNGGSMRMMIADYDHGELDLVRIEVNGDRLQHWINDPEGSARSHDYGTGGNGAPD